MIEIKSGLTARMTRNHYRRAAIWLLRAGAVAVPAFAVDMVLLFAVTLTDSRCWSGMPDCGAPWRVPLHFIMYACIVVVPVGLVGGLFLLGLVTVTDPQRDLSEPPRHDRAGQSTLSREAAMDELRRIRAAGLSVQEQEQEIQALRDKVDGQ